MTEQNVATASEPQGGVPTEVTDELAILASELTAMQTAAERRRMTTIIIFVVILAIITGYMTVVYTGVKSKLGGKEIAMLAIGGLNSFMEKIGLPPVSDPEFGKKSAAALNTKVPELLRDEVKPEVDKIIGKLKTDPEGQLKAFEDAVFPQIDKAAAAVGADMMPAARRRVHAETLRQIDLLLENLELEMKKVVDDVVAINQENMKDLTPEKRAKLKIIMTDTFMKELKPRVDDFLTEIELGHKINNLKVDMDALVAKIDGTYKPTDEDLKEARKLQQTVDQLKAGKMTELDTYLILLIQKMTKVGEGIGPDTRVDTPVE